MLDSSNYVQVLTDFLKNNGIEVEPEKANWLRFIKSNALCYVNASKEYQDSKRGYYGWYDLNTNAYNELIAAGTSFQINIYTFFMKD